MQNKYNYEVNVMFLHIKFLLKTFFVIFDNIGNFILNIMKKDTRIFVTPFNYLFVIMHKTRSIAHPR